MRDLLKLGCKYTERAKTNTTSRAPLVSAIYSHAAEVFGTAMNVALMVNRSTWNCVVTVILTAQFVIRHAWQEPERAILPLPSM